MTLQCLISSWPTVDPEPCRSEKTPSGIPVFVAAFTMAEPTIALVPGWARWAFTITEFPPAKAEAVSPPAVENAKGKLLAAKTTTGPNGTRIRRISGLGTGSLSGWAVSMVASNQEPFSIKLANIWSCAIVRPRSPRILTLGNPDSAQHLVINLSPKAAISSAIAFKNSAFSLPEILL